MLWVHNICYVFSWSSQQNDPLIITKYSPNLFHCKTGGCCVQVVKVADLVLLLYHFRFEPHGLHVRKSRST